MFLSIIYATKVFDGGGCLLVLSFIDIVVCWCCLVILMVSFVDIDVDIDGVACRCVCILNGN